MEAGKVTNGAGLNWGIGADSSAYLIEGGGKRSWMVYYALEETQNPLVKGGREGIKCWGAVTKGWNWALCNSKGGDCVVMCSSVNICWKFQSGGMGDIPSR